MTSIYWTTGSGFIELEFESVEECEACSHPGPCDSDVNKLSHTPAIATQLAELDPGKLRDTLRDFGAWDDEELADHDANLQRVLWIAACDVAENPEGYT